VNLGLFTSNHDQNDLGTTVHILSNALHQQNALCYDVRLSHAFHLVKIETS